MSTTKFSKLLFVTILVLVIFISCKYEDESSDFLLGNETKMGKLLQDETWYANKIYELEGKVIVPNGITLTIQPGTIIKGRQGDGLNASALIVSRGGKLIAEGTANAPIIFTSVIDNIELGQKTGTNLDENDVQKWGGLIILGKAKVSAKIGDTQGHIEGIPADADYGTYGGNDDNDNSGSLKYVSIRHGGITIGSGNEINGLTLGGVGAGTTIDYVEIIANLDDGIECFGGSVTINHALVAYQQDDAFDIDQNFSGAFKNSMVIYKSTVGDEFLEIDGPENSTFTNGMFTIENCTFIDIDNNGSCDLKSKAQGSIKNNLFTGLSNFKISTKLDTDCTSVLMDAYKHYINGTLILESNHTDANLQIYTKSNNGATTPVICSLPTNLQTAANAIYNVANNTTNNNVNSVNQSEFQNWTWMAANNKF